MRKKILFLALFAMSMHLNAQTVLSTNNQVKKLYIEALDATVRNYKIHSVDTCAFIKHSFFDDQTKELHVFDGEPTEFASPYSRITDDSRCYFCDRCMTEALIAEFKKRVDAYLRKKRY